MKTLKMIFCRHEYEYIRTLYGNEINTHNGKRKEYRCIKCGIYEWIQYQPHIHQNIGMNVSAAGLILVIIKGAI